jgi:hypothetical protein
MTGQPVQARALEWGVKQSFCNYVAMSGGTIETGGGAERSLDGAFVFPAAPGTALERDAEGRLSGRAAFVGEVRFEAHGGMLRVALIDPAVEFGPEGAVLSVADGERRADIARLDLAGQAADEDGAIILPALLAMAGIYLLGDHYPLNTALDPVRLVTAAD